MLLLTPTSQGAAPYLDMPLIVDTGDPIRTMETAVILMDTNDSAAVAARMLGSPWTAESVHAAISVVPAGQSNIVDVTATDHSPALAVKLANVYVAALLRSRMHALRPVSAAALRNVKAQLARVKDPTSASATALEEQVGVLQAIVAGMDPNIARAAAAVSSGGRQGPPPWLIVTLAVLAGAVLASGTALLLEAVAPRRIRTETELLQVFGLPILARVPTGRTWWRGRRPLSHGQLDVVSQEPFRSLRLQFELMTPHPRVLMIAGPTRSDGKTTTSVGLALELAASGASVILADADLRSPRARRLLSLDERPSGPSDSLPTFVPLEELLEEVPDVTGLRFLELHQFAELNAVQPVTATIAEVIQQAADMADYVIVDTAPLGEVSDALPLIRAVDEVLVVVRLGNSRRTSLEVTRDLLARSGAGAAGYIVVGRSERLPTDHDGYKRRPAFERAR